MADRFQSLSPVLQALIAGLFTWGVTALGAAFVFGFLHVQRKMLDGMLGFAGGVMLAASYWSLLAPSIAVSAEQGWPSWLPPAIGFLLGGGFLYGLDRMLPHLHLGLPKESAEGPRSNWERSVLLVAAITLHNSNPPRNIPVSDAPKALRGPSLRHLWRRAGFFSAPTDSTTFGHRSHPSKTSAHRSLATKVCEEPYEESNHASVDDSWLPITGAAVVIMQPFLIIAVDRAVRIVLG